MDKLKVFVTGHSGFIGSYLMPILSENEHIIPIQWDDHMVKSISPDVIVHLAGSFHGGFDNLMKSNVMFTQNICEVAGRYNSKIIYASTGAVYGEPINGESFESDPLFPNTDYGLSKMFGEKTIEYYSRRYGFKYVILRFPNVYGKGNKKGVIYNFINDIQTKGEITIDGDGNQSRNFLHVTDACNAILSAIDYDKSDIFNISNPVKTSINDVVELLRKKYKFDVVRKDSINNLHDLLLNIDKARVTLGFSPAIKDIVLE